MLYLGCWLTTQVTWGLCPILQGSCTLNPFMVRDSWVCPQGPYSVGSLAFPGALWADAALTAAWGHPNNTSRSITHRRAALLAQRPVPPPSSDHGNIGSSGHLFFYLCPHACPPRAGHDPRRSNPASLLAGAGASVGSPVLPNSHGAPSPFPWPHGSGREMPQSQKPPLPLPCCGQRFPDPGAQLFLHLIPSGPPAHSWASGL